MVKNPPVMREIWVEKIPWRRARQPTPLFLPGESPGPRSLAGCSPWGCKDLDMTERLSTTKGSLDFSPFGYPISPASLTEKTVLLHYSK